MLCKECVSILCDSFKTNIVSEDVDSVPNNDKTTHWQKYLTHVICSPGITRTLTFHLYDTGIQTPRITLNKDIDAVLLQSY